jgi:hypothetical protein
LSGGFTKIDLGGKKVSQQTQNYFEEDKVDLEDTIE